MSKSTLIFSSVGSIALIITGLILFPLFIRVEESLTNIVLAFLCVIFGSLSFIGALIKMRRMDNSNNKD